MSVKPPSTFLRSWYKWKALRLPWRRKFLIGLDLQGNTYWEFRIPGSDPNYSQTRWRRIVQYPRSTHYSEVKVPPQWHQWLRYQREQAPSLQEQSQDLVRQQQLKVLAAEADARWAAKPSLLDMPETDEATTPGQNGGIPVPPHDARSSQTHKATAEGASDSNVESRTRAEESPKSDAVKGGDPWKKARGPSEDWQPEAWNPASSRKR